jgi:cytochrome c1
MRLLNHVPSLATGYYRPEWLERFLLEPHDLRPNLPATMPRLAMKAEEARDIAAYLGKAPEAQGHDAGGADAGHARVLEGANLERGGRLLQEKGCVTCHVLSGALLAAPSASTPSTTVRARERGGGPPAVIALAPDLRHARERFDVPTLITWITDPDSVRRVRPNMPKTPLALDEARDIAAYLVKVELSPPATREIPARLPLLKRRVRYDEVAEKVLQKTCRHCHAEPDDALGEGGPGNTGGFGFAPRGLVLAEFEGVAAGSLDDSGERRSVFTKMADGTPLLVRALLARQAEEAGRPDPEIRGMPLGLPALTPEEIQLVETWTSGGHLR